ncbi:MAG TPA: fused MFS/spermidine synthase [Planctomycetota bacterium]|nr:fused MFS/spermidine synthase [Planctomycetota bacterium]
MAGPCALAFVSSACVMIVEVVAGRVIAKHVGHNLYTWTSVIGVVLGGITIGNMVGGRLADWFNPRRTLCVLFFAAAVACLSIPLWNYLVGDLDYLKLSEIESWPRRIAIHVVVVFLLPATVLGLMGPVIAKTALDMGLATGRTVGNVYAWGALGSIVGTVAAGFDLIQWIGTDAILFNVAGGLAVVGLLVAVKPGMILLVLFTAIAFLQLRSSACELVPGGGPLSYRVRAPRKEGDRKTILHEAESQYSYIEVSKTEGYDELDLVLDDLTHAYYVPGDPTDLRYEYEKVYASATRRFAPEGGRPKSLFLGGGGYIFPRYLSAIWPGARNHVAEIDPGVTRACLTAFGLKPEEIRIVTGDIGWDRKVVVAPAGPAGEPDTLEEALSGGKEAGAEVAPVPIEIHHLDARNYVEDLVRQKRKGEAFEPFDFVYGDAFNDFSVPYHLTTREFAEKVKEILQPRTGLYLVNIIDIYASSRFLGSVYVTLGQVFPHVYVFANSEGGPDEREDERDTFIVICAMEEKDLAELGFRAGELEFTGSLLEPKHLDVLEERSRGITLTDNFAPVENLLEPVVLTRD